MPATTSIPPGLDGLATAHASTSQVEISAIIIVAVIAIVIFRQFQPQRIRLLTFIMIALLLAVGFQPPGPAARTAEGITVLLVGLTISAAFGIVRGSTIPTWADEAGRVWTKGNRTTLWLWLATVVTRLVVGGVAALAFHQPINIGALWLGFGVTLAAQALVVLSRGRSAARVATT